MQCKLFVSLQLEVAHHFIERYAGGRTGGFEPPITFGAAKAPKMLLFNPHELSTHGRLCRPAPSPSDVMPDTRLPSKGRTVVCHVVSSAAASCPIAADTSGRSGRMRKSDERSLHVLI